MGKYMTYGNTMGCIACTVINSQNGDQKWLPGEIPALHAGF